MIKLNKTNGFIALGLAAIIAIAVVPKKKKALEIPIRIGDLAVMIYGSGQIKANKSFTLKIGTNARLTQLWVSLGQKVKKGAKIADFDGLNSAYSPISGTVTQSNVKTGETAFAQSEIITVTDSSDLYFEMSLDQRSARLVRIGQKASLSFDGYRDQKFLGRVKSVFSSASQFFAIVSIENPDTSFLPGMSADVAIEAEVRRSVLLVSSSEIADGKFKVRKKSGEVATVAISIGAQDQGLTEVLSDSVEEGDVLLL